MPQVPLKPYSVKEFAAIYEVDRKTFRKWIQPFAEEIGQKNGYYFNVNQVKVIFEKIGTPESGKKSKKQ